MVSTFIRNIQNNIKSMPNRMGVVISSRGKNTYVIDFVFYFNERELVES